MPMAPGAAVDRRPGLQRGRAHRTVPRRPRQPTWRVDPMRSRSSSSTTAPPTPPSGSSTRTQIASRRCGSCRCPPTRQGRSSRCRHDCGDGRLAGLPRRRRRHSPGRDRSSPRRRRRPATQRRRRVAAGARRRGRSIPDAAPLRRRPRRQRHHPCGRATGRPRQPARLQALPRPARRPGLRRHERPPDGRSTSTSWPAAVPSATTSSRSRCGGTTSTVALSGRVRTCGPSARCGRSDARCAPTASAGPASNPPPPRPRPLALRRSAQ